METHNVETDPVEASLAFDKKLRESPAYIEMHTTLRRRTIVGLVLAVGVFVNVALGIIAVNAGTSAQHAVHQSNQALSAQHAQCVAGNIFRRNDYQTHLFEEKFLAPEPRTPEIQQKVNEFQAHFKQADKLRNCEKVK